VDVDVDGQQPLSGQGGVRHRLGGLKQTPLPETGLPEADVPDTRLPTDVLR
jgi:hypothetical protein